MQKLMQLIHTLIFILFNIHVQNYTVIIPNAEPLDLSSCIFTRLEVKCVIRN